MDLGQPRIRLRLGPQPDRARRARRIRPYIEIMAGVYTDNQPDFSFLQPGETKTWSQYWYPIQKIGPAQDANLEAVSRRVGQRPPQLRLGVAVPPCIPRPGYRERVLPNVRKMAECSGCEEAIARFTCDLAPGGRWSGNQASARRCRDRLATARDGRPAGAN